MTSENYKKYRHFPFPHFPTPQFSLPVYNWFLQRAAMLALEALY